jgi:hypothetical protein
MNATEDLRIRLSGPADVLAAVPYLIGYHPAGDLAVLGFTGAAGRLCLATATGLPAPPHRLDLLAPALAGQGVDRAVLAGFGPGTLVTPAVDGLRARLGAAGVQVVEALRAEDGRFWSYLCDRADCCPPEGTPYDPASHPVAALAAFGGMAALPDLRALEDTAAGLTAPAAGEERRAVREATAREGAALREAAARAAGGGHGDRFAAEFVADGLRRVRDALAVYRAGGRLDDAGAVRLGLALAVIRVRDEAWTLVGDDSRDAHLRLWGDLVRRLEPGFVPPAAALLGMAAWWGDDRVLAGAAVRRALDADPGYTMARLIDEGLRHLVPPAALRERMPTPEDLDAEMGEPRASWLLPLLALTGDGRASPAA